MCLSFFWEGKAVMISTDTAQAHTAMKGSAAVFSNQGNPFPSQARSKTHYRPSNSQLLSAELKNIVLSPDRIRMLPAFLSDPLSPPDLNFLQGSQQLVPGPPASDSSEPFNESWPSTEGSSSKTPERDGPFSSDMPHTDSVIAKYIARFRSGLPTSRLERSPPKVDMKEFWWLQTSPDSPDTQRCQNEPGVKAKFGFSLQDLEKTTSLEDVSLSESKLYSEEADIVTLQKKAEKLISQSESSVSSVGAVSSEGLGLSSLSSISYPGYDSCNSKQPITLQAPSTPILHPPITLIQPTLRARPVLAPEEDILYQWRLRRKMEQAREELPTYGRTPSPSVRILTPAPVVQSADLIVSDYSGQSQRPAQGPVVPSPKDKPSRILNTGPSGYPVCSPALSTPFSCPVIPPHLHHTCDILPCIQHQQPSPRTPERDSSTQKLTQTPGPAHSAPAVESQEKRPEREPQNVPSKKTYDKDLKRLSRRHEKRVKSKAPGSKKAETGPMEKVPVRQGKAAPPASPVHSIMGQVISERLFSPQASPRWKSESVQRACTPETLEIAAQLLEEAEESDGTEFEDDPLLGVLREQRENLRMRLRNVDKVLAEMESSSQAEQSQFD
ncbi:Hypothetical predicted protein [Pelobates cultripes]|uniref:Proline and serine rich 3 n=1 Tax=Pelobates cultripes TaxID=61616 RepID=A0AAD1T7B5_PELCU|nr:Hypothetical predicted protein [Pelobates cultripes]